MIGTASAVKITFEEDKNLRPTIRHMGALPKFLLPKFLLDKCMAFVIITIMKIDSKQFSVNILCYRAIHRFHSSRISPRIALFALTVFAVVSAASPLVAQQQFSLIGAWRHTESATKDSPAFTTTLVFKPDGTFDAQTLIAPRPKLVGTIVKWWGRYRATGATSWVGQLQFYQACSSGGACASCPGDERTCRFAQALGMEFGVQKPDRVRMQGPNKFIDKNGKRWFRVSG
jgi:hypothetical protein